MIVSKKKGGKKAAKVAKTSQDTKTTSQDTKTMPLWQFAIIVTQLSILGFGGIVLMSTMQEALDKSAQVIAALGVVKTQLDTIQELVAGLRGGQIATQEQVDALNSALQTALDSTNEIDLEEDAIVQG